jgi:hypothetical protein
VLEETHRLEVEANRLHGHHWEVLRAHQMRGTCTTCVRSVTLLPGVFYSLSECAMFASQEARCNAMRQKTTLERASAHQRHARARGHSRWR